MSDTPPADPRALSQAQPASATESLYRAALGPRALGHYLPAFARFDELGVARPHWNHAAGWLGWHWLLYRRLWRAALLHMALLALALGAWWWLQANTGPWPAGVRWGLLAAIAVVAVAAPGWWGDAWLHAAVRQRMTDAVREAKTVQEACDRLARPALAHKAWVLVVLLEIAALLAWRMGGPPWGDSPPPRPERLVGEAVPAPPAAPPAEPPPAPAPSVPPSPPPAEPPAAPAPEPVPAPAVPAPAPAPVTVAAPAPAPDNNAALRPRLGGHGVSVGIFADPANAERVAKRLRDAGLPVVSDPLESARGTLTRVRVGPLESAEEAAAAAETVRNLGLEARPYGPR